MTLPLSAFDEEAIPLPAEAKGRLFAQDMKRRCEEVMRALRLQPTSLALRGELADLLDRLDLPEVAGKLWDMGAHPPGVPAADLAWHTACRQCESLLNQLSRPGCGHLLDAAIAHAPPGAKVLLAKMHLLREDLPMARTLAMEEHNNRMLKVIDALDHPCVELSASDDQLVRLTIPITQQRELLSTLLEVAAQSPKRGVELIQAFVAQSPCVDLTAVLRDPLLQNHPRYAALHADPEWQALLLQIAQAPEELAVIAYDVGLVAFAINLLGPTRATPMLDENMPELPVPKLLLDRRGEPVELSDEQTAKLTLDLEDTDCEIGKIFDAIDAFDQARANHLRTFLAEAGTEPDRQRFEEGDRRDNPLFAELQRLESQLRGMTSRRDRLADAWRQTFPRVHVPGSLQVDLMDRMPKLHKRREALQDAIHQASLACRDPDTDPRVKSKLEELDVCLRRMGALRDAWRLCLPDEPVPCESKGEVTKQLKALWAMRDGVDRKLAELNGGAGKRGGADHAAQRKALNAERQHFEREIEHWQLTWKLNYPWDRAPQPDA